MATWRRRWWYGALALTAVAIVGCATGQMADPDSDGFIEEDAEPKLPTDDARGKGEDTGEGEDAVVAADEGVTAPDGGAIDAGTRDTGAPDSGAMDSGPRDAGVSDAGPRDTRPVDTGVIDTGPRDTGPVDTGRVDTGPVDTGPTGPTGPSIVCSALFGNRTCRGRDGLPPCCIAVTPFATACGCVLPLVGCFACP